MTADKAVITSYKAPLRVQGRKGKINRKLGGHYLSLMGLHEEEFGDKSHK